MSTTHRAFKEKLDKEHAWPGMYMFKFIVPKEKQDAILELFPGEKIAAKESKGGKYISYTIKMMMESSDAVIAIYEEAHKVEGVIAL